MNHIQEVLQLTNYLQSQQLWANCSFVNFIPDCQKLHFHSRPQISWDFCPQLQKLEWQIENTIHDNTIKSLVFNFQTGGNWGTLIWAQIHTNPYLIHTCNHMQLSYFSQQKAGSTRRINLCGEMKGKEEKERQKMWCPSQQQHTTLTVVEAE